MSCSSPRALFDLESAVVEALANLKANNKSENADRFVWTLDGKEISEEFDLDFPIMESGNYSLELTAIKNNNQSTYAETIFVNAPQLCHVLISTSYGDLVVELFEETPIHLRNFTDLIKQSYYDGIAFHRVIDGFMIQAGDVKTKIQPSNILTKSEIPSEFRTEFVHTRGALAAARKPDNVNPEKASSGTQFYIVSGTSISIDDLNAYSQIRDVKYTDEQIQNYLDFGGTPQLDGEYTVFGKLIDGYDVLDKISMTQTDPRDKPIEDIRILKMKMIN